MSNDGDSMRLLLLRNCSPDTVPTRMGRPPAAPDASAPLRAYAGSDAAPPRLRLVAGAPGDAKTQRKRRQRTR